MKKTLQMLLIASLILAGCGTATPSSAQPTLPFALVTIAPNASSTPTPFQPIPWTPTGTLLSQPVIDPDDLLYAHVGSMDACARGLLIAAQMMKDGKMEKALTKRYAKWEEPQNQAMLAGKESLDKIAGRVISSGLEPQPKSGRQEYLEGLLNTYI